MIAARRSDSQWRNEWDAIRAWRETRPTTISAEPADKMLKTIIQPPSAGAAPMVILHCYADLPSGTTDERRPLDIRLTLQLGP